MAVQNNTKAQQEFVHIPLGTPMPITEKASLAMPNNWLHGLCGCFGDCDSCCITFCCPCITYGEVHHRIQNKTQKDYNRCCNVPCWSFAGLMLCGAQWVMGCMQRGELRRKYNLDGSGCGDCVKHFFCECCTLVQEDRESKTRQQLMVTNIVGYQAARQMQYDQMNQKQN
ncbi:hypothetical protein H072_6363 [Dactylellina haptotyla CBS 200.50]|uniref:Uncharacterized protein n=1 Tax=Dactylellina haptotyla (strain CBS 200.50) TaxID=1284197 RepID=S8BXC7_DACHA|nr:hypothetical protein H072_6363 [Dactylellina haptotyla CBS 200.50]